MNTGPVLDFTPLVSICIPVYNCEKFVGEAIESALNQTYKNTEILVVDNCSTDHTVDVVKKYEQQGVKFLQNEKNLGVVGNMNSCVKHAKGDFIKFLCSDDVLHPCAIEKMLNIFKMNKKVKIVYAGSSFIDEEGKPILMFPILKKTDAYIESGAKNVARILNYRLAVSITYTNLMAPRQLFTEMGDYITLSGSGYNSDLEFACRVLMKHDCYYIGERLAFFREHGGRGTYNSLNCENFIKRLLEYMNYIIDKNQLTLSAYSLYRRRFSIFRQGMGMILRSRKFSLIPSVINTNFPWYYHICLMFYLMLIFTGKKIAQKIYLVIRKARE